MEKCEISYTPLDSALPPPPWCFLFLTPAKSGETPPAVGSRASRRKLSLPLLHIPRPQCPSSAHRFFRGPDSSRSLPSGAPALRSKESSGCPATQRCRTRGSDSPVRGRVHSRHALRYHSREK